MKNYKPTIGLEIHAELKTKTKMFCNSKNNPNETKPNINICPVCMAHPGTLPVINKKAVESVLRVGVALGGKLADFTEFDRKNYFYPDIPKGYQISQYKYPLVSGGKLAGVDITRVHLEEDTAKSIHEDAGLYISPNFENPKRSQELAKTTTGGHSLIDFNRAGVPLMELVTEPVVKDAEQASVFARELQVLLRYLDVSNANMDKGEMRIEANISVSDTEKFGTKVEVKNLNSFKVVEKAIAYEIKRQIEVIEKGEKIVQETRGWDENKQVTFSQRLKEGSEDYRYFPDPDLPKLKLSELPEFDIKKLEESLPELPWEKRERYEKEYGIKSEDIEMYVSDKLFGDFFEKVVKGIVEVVSGQKTQNTNKDSGLLRTSSSQRRVEDLVKLASNYITSDVVGLKKNSNIEGFGKIEIDNFSHMIRMVGEGKISSRGAKDILKIMFEEGGVPEEIADKNNLIQKSDEGELREIILKVIEENKNVVEEYKNGKEASLKFLIGQGMRETKGSANPNILQDLFVKELK